MHVRHLRLALGTFFLLAGTGLMVVRFGFPEVVERISTPRKLFVGALFALVMGGLNVARWYVLRAEFLRRATPVGRPLQPDPAARPAPEYHPEFDFENPRTDPRPR